MRILAILLTTVTLCISCSSTYFYSTINTLDPYSYKSPKGVFIQEGDSLDVTYSFFGENAPITIGIINKTSHAVYIDWRKSGVVIDSMASPFAERTFHSQYGNEEINFTEYMSNPHALSYIRPYSKLERKVMELTNFNFDRIDKTLFTLQHTEADKNGKNRQLKNIQYTENNSPLLMKIYLSVFDESSNKYDPLIFESDFYISELILGSKHSGIHSFKEGHGNIFFVKYEKKNIINKLGDETLKAAGITASNIALWAVEGAVKKE